MTNADASVSEKRSILVTGGSGFVGQAVVGELLAHGYRLFATYCSAGPDLNHPSLTWVQWDAAQTAVPDIRWDDIDTVLHLAAPRKDAQDRPRLYQVIVASTFALLEQARRAGVPRVLVASTGDALASLGRPVCEADRLYEPGNFYGITKACAELLVHGFASELTTAVLRFYHPYGPGGDGFLVNRLLRMVVEGQPVTIDGEDGIWLNPVWVDDLARGVRLAIQSKQAGTFHFAGPEIVSLRQLLELSGQIARRAPIIHVKPGPASFSHAATFEHTQRVLQYVPEISLRQGLERLLSSSMDRASHA